MSRFSEFSDIEVYLLYRASVESSSYRITVSKRIKLTKSYTTTHNTNAFSKRKPKWVETLHTDSFIKVISFENLSSSKIYPPTIYGEDVEDLQGKLTAYLNGLVEMCNEPYRQCEHCDGHGVIVDKKD
jgi:hypothetical protein